MKDRWKLLIACLVIGATIVALIALIGASFRLVPLRSYGIKYYSIYDTVENQEARSNGNYLIGLDHRFHTFPRGIITLNFHTVSLTKDKSLL